MKRSKVYLLAAALSFILYFAGMFTGFYLQRLGIEYTEERIKALQIRIENIQLEYTYLSAMGSNVSCNFLSVLSDDVNRELYEIGMQLTTYESSGADQKKSAELANEYSLLSVKAWMLNSYINQKCGEDKVVILYFYSVPCQDCGEQGKLLDGIREKFKDRIQIFVLNTNSNEKIVQLLVKTYNISQTPSLVIGNSTYVGLVGREGLEKIILS